MSVSKRLLSSDVGVLEALGRSSGVHIFGFRDVERCYRLRRGPAASADIT